MSRRGFTLVEFMVALGIVGVALAIALPRLRDGMTRETVRSARREVTTQLARARATAVQRGCRATAHFATGNPRVWVTSCRVAGAGLDTVGSIAYLRTRYGVAMNATADSVIFGPHGIATGSQWVAMRFTKSGYSDTLAISPVGRAVWR